MPERLPELLRRELQGPVADDQHDAAAAAGGGAAAAPLLLLPRVHRGADGRGERPADGAPEHLGEELDARGQPQPQGLVGDGARLEDQNVAGLEKRLSAAL